MTGSSSASIKHFSWSFCKVPVPANLQAFPTGVPLFPTGWFLTSGLPHPLAPCYQWLVFFKEYSDQVWRWDLSVKYISWRLAKVHNHMWEYMALHRAKREPEVRGLLGKQVFVVPIMSARRPRKKKKEQTQNRISKWEWKKHSAHCHQIGMKGNPCYWAPGWKERHSHPTPPTEALAVDAGFVLRFVCW